MTQTDDVSAPPATRVIVPTYNGGSTWNRCAEALARAVAGRPHLSVLVVDSSSHDGTAETARRHGFDVISIDPADFNHGGTRNLAAGAAQAEFLVFLTQDAIVQGPESITELLAAFRDPKVAAAYGRQLPHPDANPVAAHARYANYGTAGHVCGLDDIPRCGLKAAFLSNSFAAYRTAAFRQLGGFPDQTILGEDMYFAARAILEGFLIAYVPSACVWHSHNYSVAEEFRRYFDIGVFQSEESWIGERYGGAGGEGLKFLKSEFSHLARHAPLWLPRAWLGDLAKILGYRLGKQHRRLPPGLRRACSMHRRYWEEGAAPRPR